MRDMLPSQALVLINSFPFSAKEYERAKAIVQTKYGKTSEVVNAHIPWMMSLPTINGISTTKIHYFYERLVNSVQSLGIWDKLKVRYE